jgi:hypothetical protein
MIFGHESAGPESKYRGRASVSSDKELLDDD